MWATTLQNWSIASTAQSYNLIRENHTNRVNSLNFFAEAGQTRYNLRSPGVASL